MDDNKMKFMNSFFSIDINIDGVMYPSNVMDIKNNYYYADLPYYYSINDLDRVFPKYLSHEILEFQDSRKLILEGLLDDVCIKQEYVLKNNEPILEELITLKNETKKVIKINNLGFGFAKNIRDLTGWWSKDIIGSDFTAVPFMRDMRGKHGDYEKFTIKDLVSKQGSYRLDWKGPVAKIPSSEFGAEGWVWNNSNGGMLVAKHNPYEIEFSLLRVHWYNEIEQSLSTDDPRQLRCLLRIGGIGIWHGEPEIARELKPGESLIFGKTRYTFVDSNWKSGYYAFRDFMNEEGHGLTRNYRPLVHWNELYDNPLWWIGQGIQEKRQEYYRLEDMEAEALKAKELGCEALYLDPGWDIRMGSDIWAGDRMVALPDFIEKMRSVYGLEVALHNTFASWADSRDFPAEVVRADKEGKTINEICGGSKLFIETKATRIKELAKNGVKFFMIDGTWFSGTCYNTGHGHDIPYTRRQHCEAIFQLVQSIKKEYPDVIIEMHDPVLSGDVRYTQCHYKHALPNSFNDLWACEYMWDPLDDILTGRAISLYYYNLAYEIPLYIHIDLRKDNMNALAFWWFASTCRHFGVGGKEPGKEIWKFHQEWLNHVYRPFLDVTTRDFHKHDPYPLPALWSVHKEAMSQYIKLKEFFVYGKFYGIDETIHIHALKGKGAVAVVFNLSEQHETRTIALKAEDIDLIDFNELIVGGSEYELKGDDLLLSISIEKHSPKVVYLSQAI